MSENKPPRPITPFFLFLMRVRGEGKRVSGEAAGALWRGLSQQERKGYIDVYLNSLKQYAQYVKEVVGVPQRDLLRLRGRPEYYPIHKIRALCGSQPTFKPLSNELSPALGLVLVILELTVLASLHEGFRTRTQPETDCRTQEGRHRRCSPLDNFR